MVIKTLSISSSNSSSSNVTSKVYNKTYPSSVFNNDVWPPLTTWEIFFM